MIDVFQISDLKIGSTAKIFAVCQDKSLRKTKNGDLYIDIFLRDRSASVFSKLWSNVDYFENKFDAGDIVFVKGKIDLYRKQKQFNISSIGRADESRYQKYGFSHNSIHQYINEDLNIIWNETTNFIKELKPSYRPVVKKFISNYKASLIEASNVGDLKFQLKGSLVKNLSQCLKLARQLCKAYPSANKNIIIISFFLKYVAVSEIFRQKSNNNFPLLITKLSRSYLKSFKINDVLSQADKNKINNIFSSGTSNLINQNEYVSIESLVVNDLEAQIRTMSIMDQVISGDESSGNWTDKFNPLRRRVFKG
ncbi:MAG: hypothetical protein CBD58_00750 [bacterium TMED198]|nr:MAG: hypothetical protein CBD58_00750 [bacterium TMED198]